MGGYSSTNAGAGAGAGSSTEALLRQLTQPSLTPTASVQLPVGNLRLRARVSDALGAAAMSAPVDVSVGAPKFTAQQPFSKLLDRLLSVAENLQVRAPFPSNVTREYPPALLISQGNALLPF